MEMYILNNIENKSKNIKYLLFRYKFHLAGEKKINFGCRTIVKREKINSILKIEKINSTLDTN